MQSNTELRYQVSRGIGAATAILAKKHGFAVGVNYHKNQQAAENIVSETTVKGGTAVAIQADISKEDDVLKLFRNRPPAREFACTRQQCRNIRAADRRVTGTMLFAAAVYTLSHFPF